MADIKTDCKLRIEHCYDVRCPVHGAEKNRIRESTIRHDCYQRVINELNTLALNEQDKNLKACAEMSAGDLQEFLNGTSKDLEYGGD